MGFSVSSHFLATVSIGLQWDLLPCHLPRVLLTMPLPNSQHIYPIHLDPAKWKQQAPAKHSYQNRTTQFHNPQIHNLMHITVKKKKLLPYKVNPLNPELNPICYLLALLAHHFFHVSRIRVKSLTLRLLMSYIYMERLFLMFLYHTQRRTTVGRTPLDEWSARRRDLYLTTHNIHSRETSMPPVGLEPTIPASEWP